MKMKLLTIRNISTLLYNTRCFTCASNSCASEVTTIWRYTNVYIIIIIITEVKILHQMKIIPRF